uniref:cardiolipin synthase (CMP-forming) n=1 Tax=Echinococcus canadensis TaxID=519352 RepID=A0A915EWR8_9CEST
MSALVSANIQRLVRLSTRHSIFNPVSKPPNCLHAIPSSCFGNNSSSKPQSRIVTIPNILTSLRIGATPSIFFLILRQDLSSAAILAAVIGLTDAADGYIARRFPSQQSVTGSYLDPLADKLFISLLSVAMAYTNLFPVSLVALFLMRDALLLAGASYLRFVSLGHPWNTTVQITAVFSSLMAPVLGLQDSLALPALWLTAASTTIYSGFGYAQSFPSFFQEALRISASKKREKR